MSWNLFNIVLGSLLIGVILLGDYATAIFAGFSVVSNTFFGMIQEFSAKRQLDRLAALSEQNVPCLRDGKWIDVPMRKVVKDEMIRVEPGDRLVVDGEIARSDSLEMDESLLTGESEAISKAPRRRSVLPARFVPPAPASCALPKSALKAILIGYRPLPNNTRSSKRRPR